MIIERIIVGSGYVSCNCYFIGPNTENIFIIDPGAESDKLINKIEELYLKPKAIILTHAHPDHTRALRKIKRFFSIPLYYNRKEYKLYIRIKPERWVSEGDIISLDSMKFHFLETPGHSPGSISFYVKEEVTYEGVAYDGVLFPGDALVKGGVGDLPDELNKLDTELLFHILKNKIFYNKELTDNFLVLAGHIGSTTIGEERRLNPYGEEFLTEEDWKRNKYYGKDVKEITEAVNASRYRVRSYEKEKEKKILARE